MKKSSGISDASIGRGQTLKSAYPLDNVSGVDLPDTKGGSMRGGTGNLAHSLSGCSVPDDIGAAGSVKHTIIKDH